MIRILIMKKGQFCRSNSFLSLAKDANNFFNNYGSHFFQNTVNQYNYLEKLKKNLLAETSQDQWNSLVLRCFGLISDIHWMNIRNSIFNNTVLLHIQRIRFKIGWLVNFPKFFLQENLANTINWFESMWFLSMGSSKVGCLQPNAIEDLKVNIVR